MPSSSSDFLELASSLSQEANEVAHRAAVSRAYYSVYHHGLSLVELKMPEACKITYPGGVHAQLTGRMFGSKEHAWKTIAYRVRDLKKERVEADYSLQAEVTATDATDAVLKARDLIRQMNDL